MNTIVAKTVLAASGADATINDLISKITQNIISPVIQFMFLLATAYFVWGMIGFFKSADDGAREEGRQHILWGTIGMVIMISVYGIVRLIANTVGQSGRLGF